MDQRAVTPAGSGKHRRMVALWRRLSIGSPRTMRPLEALLFGSASFSSGASVLLGALDIIATGGFLPRWLQVVLASWAFLLSLFCFGCAIRKAKYPPPTDAEVRKWEFIGSLLVLSFMALLLGFFLVGFMAFMP